MNARRAKRKARLARRKWRLEHPEQWAILMADVLKRIYPQAKFHKMAYRGARILGGKAKRRYGGPEYRVIRHAPNPFVAFLESHADEFRRRYGPIGGDDAEASGNE